ncbi:metallophosphoesterase [Candidatus Magnetominusculus xianensis]|uniref:Phosphoesterase n=1 Tax=Candidatus Magnetominusculus xianensis TaxID=1748249 RepID=A0ABR5SJ14_9BACT|nr:metallophosphoesterase [Candidatus Magnetominusculus xianensis]KWT93338.1 phosphodiesterase [Candidatus Magnetominusculus xianensis]
MLIGVMSDSHDNMSNLVKAVRVFNESNLRYVLHAGDFTTVNTLRTIEDLNAEFIGIFGNNDSGILSHGPLELETNGWIHRQPHEFTIDNKKFVMIHEHFLVDSIVKDNRCDVLIYGHTHKPEAQQRNGTYILNPGELCGWLHGSPTVAILDTKSMEARIIGLG